MSYYRFTRLQQYINGQPTDVYKKGERVDDVDYSTYEACMGSSADTRWVSIPQTVCYDGDLWSMEKEQISYDGGTSWSDTGNSRRASVIEQSSAQCFMNDWRVVPNEYICMMYAKWTKEAEYVSYDGGQTWTATGNIRRGETVIEQLSADCGVIYQWIPTGEYICQGYNKYMKEKQVYSTDNGSTWTDTGNRRTGGLIEADSPYCGYEEYIYQWVDVTGEYVCQGYDKYTKQKEQRSSDNGQTWTDTGNTRAGEYIESLSTDCGVTYRWITVPNDYVCVGYDKYSKEKQQYSTNSGSTWTDTGNTRAGSTLIESHSEDCGTQYRWVADTGYVCVGHDKYNKEKEQYSTDGTTWTDTGNTRAGSTLLETDSVDCGYSPYAGEYLTTEALGNGNISLRRYYNYNGYKNYYPLENIQYSKNDGAWTSYTYDAFITVVTGDKISWKATIKDGNSDNYYSYFASTANYKAYGNPLSLINNDNFVNEPDAIYNFAYFHLFENNYRLNNVSNLALPATTLAESCYESMFKKCANLTTAPALPATTLATSCYKEMFIDCTSLTTAPVLPATTLANGCCDSMFYNCTSLTTAPALPATTLAYGCYKEMFYRCSSLTTVPVLPATTLAVQCYMGMFCDCTSLTTVPADMLPATTLTKWCYWSMFSGCSNLTTAPELPATTLDTECYLSMFMNCTSLTTAPELPATTLFTQSYSIMFQNCSNLNYIKCLATDISVVNNGTYNWLKGVSSTGTFTKAAGVSWPSGDSGIPSGWTVVEAS